MAFQRWGWSSLPGKDWPQLNQRFKALENFLTGLVGFTLAVRRSVDVTVPVVEHTRSLVVTNTGATTITGFKGGESGQHLTVLVQDALTTFPHGAAFILAAGVDWVTASGDVKQFYTPDGATWYEVPRG